MTTMLVAHAAVTWALVGLIWTIQLVHYPLFRYVEPSAWKTFHEQHARRITLLVGLLMPVEVLLAGALVAKDPSPATIAGAALVGVAWLSTALLQVPLHQRLDGGFEAHAHARLVSSNWIRTVAWTLRGLLAVHLLV